MLYKVSNGKKAGLMCSIGIALGLSIHIIYSALGLATVIANSTFALWVIKILGGGYLIYLGVKGLRAKPMKEPESAVNKVAVYSAKRGIGVGFLCNALNPKAPIYFVSLFTVVLSPDMPIYQLTIYGAWIMVLQLAWFSIVVGLLSRPSVLQQFKKMGHWVDRVVGGAMIALGLKVITTKVN